MDMGIKAPFSAIQHLFDYPHAHLENDPELNSIYPRLGIMKTAAMTNGSSDQKFTIGLSPKRNSLIPASLRESLASHGLDDTLNFFETLCAVYVPWSCWRGLGCSAQGGQHELPPV